MRAGMRVGNSRETGTDTSRYLYIIAKPELVLRWCGILLEPRGTFPSSHDVGEPTELGSAAL